MEQQDQSTNLFRMGPLPKEVYDNLQEFADDIAANMIGTVNAGKQGASGSSVQGPEGPAGPPGTSFTIKTESKNIPTAATFVDMDEDCTAKCVNLVVATANVPPTININAIDGRRVYLSGAAPNDGYSVSATSYVTSAS